MGRNETFKTNKRKFMNIAVLIVLVVFVWLNFKAPVIDIGVTVIAIVGGLSYINKLLSTVTITDNEIIYKSIIKQKSIKIEDIIGIDCKKRPFSKIFGGNLYELGIYTKIILVKKDETLFIVDSIYIHSSHLWYLIFKDLINKDIYVSENAKGAYTHVLKRNIGGV